MEPRWTIYCHTHIESGRRYIGLTKRTWKERWRGHVHGSKKFHGHFAHAIRKYGPEAFSHEVLEYCSTLEVANQAEQSWIEFYDSRNPEKGFNLARGGLHIPHPIKNSPWDRPEFREKRLAFLAKANALQTPQIRSKRSKELWKDPEFRENVTVSSHATTRTPEFREAMAERVKEMWKDPEFREKTEKALKERAQDPVLREALRRKWDDPDYRERCSAGARASNEAKRSATHCARGHLYNKNDSTPSGWARECHICYYERRKAARVACPEGHPYDQDNVILNSKGTRMCSICLEAASGPRPCSKCGKPKLRRSGGRFRCGPCVDIRTSTWKARKNNIQSSV
jgi:hypothetical protein